MFISKCICLINSLYNKRQLKKGRVINENVSISGRIKIININGKIRIGQGCMINSGKGHNPIGGDTICRLISYGGDIVLGNRIALSNSTIVSRNKIVIEDDVFIGGSCKIYDNDFHPLDFNERVTYVDNIPNEQILIKKGAFIGAHSIILKGVTIGEHSIIGAGSVVTRDVPDNEIWGGNPVKYIKSIG